MARYFMHLRDGTSEFLDVEGRDYESLDELRRWVLIAARKLIAADAHQGVIDFRFRVDAENEGGDLVYSLPFAGAINMIAAPAAGAFE